MGRQESAQLPEESEFLLDSPPLRLRPRWPTFFAGLLAGALLALIGGAATVSTLPSSKNDLTPHRSFPVLHPDNDTWTGKPLDWFTGPCGNSTTTARERGCTFDTLIHSWLPPDCTYPEDREDAEELVRTGREKGWKWFTMNDAGRGEMSEVAWAEVAKGETRIVFTGFEWHKVHCTLVWRRMHRALQLGRKVDSYTAAMHHTEHCGSMLLLSEDETRGGLSRVFAKWPSCA